MSKKRKLSSSLGLLPMYLFTIVFVLGPLIFMVALFTAVPSLASSVGVLVPVGVLIALGAGRVLYKKGKV